MVRNVCLQAQFSIGNTLTYGAKHGIETQDDPLQRSEADHEFDLVRELIGIGVPMGRIDYSGFDTEWVEL